MPTTPIYKLPRDLQKQVLWDYYNALLKRGISKDKAKHEISHAIICSRLMDLGHLIDIRKYRL